MAAASPATASISATRWQSTKWSMRSSRTRPLTDLINNAAGNFIARTEELSPRGFDAVANIVMHGTFYVTHAVGRRWIANKLRGNVVSITVTWVRNGSPYVVPSAMSKSAVHAMTMSLAAEWGRYGIRLNTIAPGEIPTEGMSKRIKPGDEAGARTRAINPMGRVGTMEELQNLAVFLISGGCDWINGETIAMDGGQALAMGGNFYQLREWSDADWDNAKEQIKAQNEKDRSARRVKPVKRYRRKPGGSGMRGQGPLRLGRRLCLLGLLSMALPLHASFAGDYPERTIKIVVPFPAGGPTDVAARLIAQSLATRFGKGVVVENHPGAGGRIGAKVVATATPDGYTLLLGGTNVNAIGAIFSDLGFDPVKSFAPIAVVCVDSLAIAISPRVPADNFKEFIQYAKDHPGKLKYGASPGIYTQFAGEYFKLKTGTDILFVPYKGGAPAVTDALGGHIEMVVNNKSNLLPQFKDGKLKALAVTSKERWRELPQTPTMREVGILGFPQEVLFGLLAPAGTPGRSSCNSTAP